MPPIPASLAPLGRFAWEKALRAAALPPPVRLFGAWLATYADADGGSIHPGEQLLAEHTGLTVQTVRRYMRTLREVGYIARVEQGGRRRGRADAYRLTHPRGSTVTVSPVTTSPVNASQVTKSAITGDEITSSPVTKPPPTRPGPDQDHTTRAVSLVVERLGCSAAEAERCVADVVASGSVRSSLVGYLAATPVDALRRRLDALPPPPAAPIPPPCGSCEARPDDAPAMRWRDDSTGQRVKCWECHPGRLRDAS